MARIALLGLLAVTIELTWATLTPASQPPQPRLDVDFTRPPSPTIDWPTTPFLEPQTRSGIELPHWPWTSATPNWDDAQQHPREYVAWLKDHHPGKTIKPVTALVTAYCPCAICCGSSADGRTRSNRSAYQPGIAVAEPVYQRTRKLKSSYHVPGYFPESYPGETWMPDDTGSAMLNSYDSGVLHIDVRYQNHAWALSKGVRTGTVFLIR